MLHCAVINILSIDYFPDSPFLAVLGFRFMLKEQSFLLSWISTAFWALASTFFLNSTIFLMLKFF